MEVATGDCICDAAMDFMADPLIDVCVCVPGMYLSVNGTASSC